MFPVSSNITGTKTTSFKVVLPFYIYASLSFLAACLFLFISSDAFTAHFFQPRILAITHTMALGWGTMIILGASHQLVPVIIEGRLYSEKLAYATFLFAAAGIPLLVYGFYVFNLGTPAEWGGGLIVLSVLSYLVNIFVSMRKSKGDNIHAMFVFSAILWLFFTAFLGLLLVCNFTRPLFQFDSVHYLPFHAHMGIIGWFLLLVIGVASRLIPMFLISKYSNVRLLWIIFGLINAALILYTFIFYAYQKEGLMFIPVVFVLSAAILFIYYCFKAYRQRLRKQVDEQMKLSLLSVLMILLPVILLFVIIALLISVTSDKNHLILGYGFMIFFGWLTAIIFGMTFKTLPFIVWNKVYHSRSASGKTPNPKDLFSHLLFRIMSISYLAGFILFAAGILISQLMFLKAGAFLLVITAVIYNWNVMKVISHKPVAK